MEETQKIDLPDVVGELIDGSFAGIPVEDFELLVDHTVIDAIRKIKQGNDGGGKDHFDYIDKGAK